MSSRDHLPGLQRVDHIGLTVGSVEEGVRFYSDVLGGRELYRLGPFDARDMPPLEDGRDWTEAHVGVPGARLSFAVVRMCEGFNIDLFEYERPPGANAIPPLNCDVGGHHISLKVSQLDPAIAFLQSEGVELLAGPIEIPGGPGGPARSIYFRDPWGNHLELSEYERLGWMDAG